ncbi:Hypothetical protein, putative [Bodo saltans]|uniref:Vasohibin-like protein n=1 Tax=Bodo saltans TaxID=75058 RepID=A0A0S4JV39_BODSA|nr:Hypothetical protein, putative [Bodo saltans]|eukprot:CUG94108.1 Hypothetical protein, putative [Bodo saltans]
MSIETARIQALMERMNAKNPVRLGATYEASGPSPSSSLQSTIVVPQRASESSIDRSASSSSQLDSIQVVLNRLQYNFLPQTFFTLEKNRAFYRVAGTAKEILQESLPIRCLEATFLALYLSCPMRDVERFPISFKSRAANTGQTHRHIVLGVKHKGLYGALGLSRSALLMNKPLLYKSIPELLEVYCQCYQQVGHQLISFKLGLFVTHDQYSKIVPCWRFVSLTPTQPFHRIQDCVKTATTVEHFELLLPVMSDQYLKMHTPGHAFVDVAPHTPLLANAPQAFGASVASASSATKPSSAPPQHLTIATDADDDVSDSEENQRRISCVIGMLSPFSPPSLPSSAAATTDLGRSKFSSRLRRVVHENPLETSGMVSSNSTGTATGATGTPTSRRSRTVPASRRPRGPMELTAEPTASSQGASQEPEISDAPLERQPSMGTERANAFLNMMELAPPPAMLSTPSSIRPPLLEGGLTSYGSAAVLRSQPSEPVEPRSAQSFSHSRVTHSSSETERPAPTGGTIVAPQQQHPSTAGGRVVSKQRPAASNNFQQSGGGGGVPPKKPLPKSSSSTSVLRVDI